MYICVGCRKEMLCDKNGVGANFGHGHVYASDRYKCPICGMMILATNIKAYYDPNLSFQDEYLNMDGGGNENRRQLGEEILTSKARRGGSRQGKAWT